MDSFLREKSLGRWLRVRYINMIYVFIHVAIRVWLSGNSVGSLVVHSGLDAYLIASEPPTVFSSRLLSYLLFLNRGLRDGAFLVDDSVFHDAFKPFFFRDFQLRVAGVSGDAESDACVPVHPRSLSRGASEKLCEEASRCLPQGFSFLAFNKRQLFYENAVIAYARPFFEDGEWLVIAGRAVERNITLFLARHITPDMLLSLASGLATRKYMIVARPQRIEEGGVSVVDVNFFEVIDEEEAWRCAERAHIQSFLYYPSG